jgi:hypothetical protein
MRGSEEHGGIDSPGERDEHPGGGGETGFEVAKGGVRIAFRFVRGGCGHACGWWKHNACKGTFRGSYQMHDLLSFGLSDVVACGAALRQASAGARTMEDAANEIVAYLYDNIGSADDGRALALVRLFKTHPYSGLDPAQQEFARKVSKSAEPDPSMKCLTLLATRGDEADWNSRRTSRGHLAIPLASEKMVENAPMISQLIQQLGLEIGAVLRADRDTIVDLAQKTYNVFYVADANGSPYIPAQADFVQPHGIRSVLGFGGMLPSGNLFAVIMFAKVAIGRETADLFANIALAAKLALLPFDGNATFAGMDA